MDKYEAYAILSVIAASIGGWFAKMGVLGYLLLAFTVAMIIDYASGLLASKKEAIENPNNEVYGWSSRKGMLGIIKKFGYIMIVFATILIDFLIYKIAGYVNFQMPISTFFSCITTTWFILNEALSITENAGRMGARIPPFISNLICVLKEKVEKKAEEAIGAIESKDDIDKN